MKTHYHTRRDCRVCGGTDLRPVLDFGKTPPANAFLRPGDVAGEQSYPLSVVFCADCTLLQVPDVVAPDVLFSHYVYETAASAPMVEHFKRYASDAIAPLIGGAEDLVIDVGGNDGTLLSFVAGKARVLNLDPAGNLAPLNAQRGVDFRTGFCTAETAAKVTAEYGQAQVVTANNVCAHTDDVIGLFRAIRALLAAGGTFICEVQWVGNFVADGTVDQVYHEHLCFYSLHALKRALDLAGLPLKRVQLVPTQGQSLRVFAGGLAADGSVEQMLEQEKAAGLTEAATFQTLAARAEATRQKALAFMRAEKAAGKRISGYGAPAKGNTMLNWFGVDASLIDYLVDTTPQKQGLLAPGTHIPVVAPDQLLTRRPDYLLLLAWNYRDAILAKEAALRQAGTRFIVLVPEFELV